MREEAFDIAGVVNSEEGGLLMDLEAHLLMTSCKEEMLGYRGDLFLLTVEGGVDQHCLYSGLVVFVWHLEGK